MWMEAPVLTTVIIGVPTLVIGTMCYCMWTVDLHDEDQEEDDEDSLDGDKKENVASVEGDEKKALLDQPATEEKEQHLKSE